MTGYHVVNIVIHVACGILVYLLAVATLALRTHTTHAPALSARRRELVALFAALLFVAHPVQTQAVTYVVQRMTSLATLFYLLALLLYLRGRMTEAGAGRPLFFAGALAAWLLALGSKQTAVTLPVATPPVRVHLLCGPEPLLVAAPSLDAARCFGGDPRRGRRLPEGRSRQHPEGLPGARLHPARAPVDPAARRGFLPEPGRAAPAVSPQPAAPLHDLPFPDRSSGDAADDPGPAGDSGARPEAGTEGAAGGVLHPLVLPPTCPRVVGGGARDGVRAPPLPADVRRGPAGCRRDLPGGAGARRRAPWSSGRWSWLSSASGPSCATRPGATA